jgi:hypothetical protein
MATKRQAVKCIGKRRNGSACGAYAINGSTVCWAHGGQLPRVKAKAAANITEQQVQRQLATLDVSPVGDPLHQLAILAAQMLAWRDSMADKVNHLTSLRYQSESEYGEGAEQLRAEVALWERALDRCERVLVAMAKLNIDERLARVTEQQLARIEAAVTAALAGEGLDLEAQARARHVVGRHLRIA